MPKTRKPAIDGILNIDKPYGITSMDVVRRVKRASRQRRVGHAGTLDPVATGVIPVCLGQATRLMEDLINGSKTYRADVELGASTNTYDALGDITAHSDASAVSRADVEHSLQAFIGDIMQTPPMYSALKRDGKRLYELARAGVQVELEPRPVTVHAIDLQDWTPPIATIQVRCGRGFYMRSLAHDLGQALGCGGYLKTLERLHCGGFSIADSVSLEEIEERFADGSWQDAAHAPDAPLLSLPAVILGKPNEDMIRNGRSIDRPPADTPPADGERSRAYTADGRFLATLLYDAPLRQWRPEKVFALNYPEPPSA